MDWSGVSRTLETHAKAVAAPTASMAESSSGCLSVPDLQRRQANKRHERRWIDAEPEQSEGQDGERRPAHRGDDAYRRDSSLGRRLGHDDDDPQIMALGTN